MARVNGRVPRYLQIAETLRERIRGGALSAGARLDNQRALAREFAVTLMTLKQALDRLRLVKGHPMSYQRSFLPAGIGQEVAKADLAVTPLRSALSFKLGIEITRAHETVFAVTLRSREARELGCRPGIPAFRSERISWAAAGAPIVYDRVFIPGDRFSISRELTYEGVRPKDPRPGQAGAGHRDAGENRRGPEGDRHR